MSATDGRSLASALKLAVDVAWVLSWLAVGGVLIAIVLFVAATLSGGALETGLLRAVADPESWQAIAPGLAVGLTFAVAHVVILRQLRYILATLAAGDPFVPENARRLRLIGWSVVVLELARYAIQAGTALIVAHFGQPASGALEVAFRPSFAAWTAALVLFVLAHVFREGARLRQQDQLTI
jgi:hypothetical protein